MRIVLHLLTIHDVSIVFDFVLRSLINAVLSLRSYYELTPPASPTGVTRVLLAHESGCPFFVDNVQIRLAGIDIDKAGPRFVPLSFSFPPLRFHALVQ